MTDTALSRAIEQARPPTPPERSWREARALIDLGRMSVKLGGAMLKKRRSPRETLVIALPGFGAGDWSTAPMRAWLHRQGFRVEGWGLGQNLAGLDLDGGIEDVSPRWEIEARGAYHGEAGVALLTDLMTERVRTRYEATRLPINLIGWSLGGYVAREVARDLPDIVERVITLGSPIVGGPKYTAAAGTFRDRGQDLDWIEEVIAAREVRPIQQPITAIVSPTDGVVALQAAIDRHSEHVTHVQVDGAHIGLAINPSVWEHVLASLESPTPR